MTQQELAASDPLTPLISRKCNLNFYYTWSSSAALPKLPRAISYYAAIESFDRFAAAKVIARMKATYW
jgi:hypothetical protein